MSIMSSEKKKIVRNKSKNRNKNPSQSSVVPVTSTNQSVGERLQSAVHTLQSYGSFVDLRNKASHWIKLATQVLSNPVTQPHHVKDASSAALLLLHVLDQCSPSPSDPSSKVQLSPQLLLPCVRAAVLQTGPHDLVNLPCLLMFRQLLSTHPGLCSPIKDQLEQKLKGWLNTAPEAVLEDRLHTGSSKLPRCHLAIPSINSDAARVAGDCSDVALAADVWALMPLVNSSGAAASDQQQSAASRADGLATARGKQLKQLLLTLQHTLDGLLGNVVQAQGSESLTNSTGIPLLKFLAVGKKISASTQTKNKISGADNGTVKMEDEQLGDNISDPLEMVEVSFNRCCGLLVFVERLLVSVAKGANDKITLVTRDVLLPLFRILQVSGSALHRYHSAEVQKLAKLWPALQHRALHTLHAALLALGPHLFSWYHLILDQLTNTLLAVPNAKTAPAPSKVSGATKTSDDTAAKDVSEQHFGLEKLGVSWDVVAQQETVRLVYLCLNKLARVSRNMHGTPLPLVKAIFADLSPQPNNDATLQIPSKKSIASMNIKKKSKRKGYTISTSNVPPSITLTNTHRSSLSSTQTSSTENTIENLRQPFANLSQGKSAQIISNALDLLQSTISCDQHYVLSADTATLIVGGVVRLARTYCGITDILTCRFYPSVSGLVDLRALLGSQQLMAKLFRLLPLLVVHLHPAFPPPAAELQFILREGARIHAANEPLSQACEDGLRQVGSFLANPSTAAFLDNIEKMKVSEFNKSGMNEENAQDDNELEEESDEDDDRSVNEEESVIEKEDHSTGSGDDESIDIETVAEAPTETVDEEDSDVDEENQTRGTDDVKSVTESSSKSGSLNGEDSAVNKENLTPGSAESSDDAESVTEAPPPPLKKSSKKRKTQSEEEGKLLKKKRKVSGKTKAKKAKRNSSAANVSNRSTSEAKLIGGAEDDERAEGDLSVADMLSELLD